MKFIISIFFLFYFSTASASNSFESVFEGLVCLRCHDLKTPGTGPSFEMISLKYADDPTALNDLTQVVLKGGIGHWSDEVPMPPISDIDETEAKKLVSWILSEARSASVEQSQKSQWPLLNIIIIAAIVLVIMITLIFKLRNQKA